MSTNVTNVTAHFVSIPYIASITSDLRNGSGTMDIETKEAIIGWIGSSVALLAGIAFALPFILIVAGLTFS